jgi:hypothetical protein
MGWGSTPARAAWERAGKTCLFLSTCAIGPTSMSWFVRFRLTGQRALDHPAVERHRLLYKVAQIEGHVLLGREPLLPVLAADVEQTELDRGHACAVSPTSNDVDEVALVEAQTDRFGACERFSEFRMADAQSSNVERATPISAAVAPSVWPSAASSTTVWQNSGRYAVGRPPLFE